MILVACRVSADAPRAQDPHGRSNEVLAGRHDAGEGTEEPARLLLLAGDGREEAAGPGVIGGKLASPR
jgi:hypothetical protein